MSTPTPAAHLVGDNRVTGTGHQAPALRGISREKQAGSVHVDHPLGAGQSPADKCDGGKQQQEEEGGHPFPRGRHHIDPMVYRVTTVAGVSRNTAVKRRSFRPLLAAYS